MDAVDIRTPSKLEKSFIPTLKIDSPAEMLADSRLMQDHRENLLSLAEHSMEEPCQGGCVSGISIVENAVEGPEYQEVLQEIGRLLETSAELAAALERLDLRIDVKIDTYDDNTIGASAHFGSDCNIDVCEDEIEALGYMAWIAR